MFYLIIPLNATINPDKTAPTMSSHYNLIKNRKFAEKYL